jgi:hypothetical protein
VGSMLQPNRLCGATVRPESPPVNDELLSTIALMVTASPSVTIARLIPRERTEGSPTRILTGITASIPTSTLTRNGVPWEAARFAATIAPTPPRVSWASESCPA